MAKKSVVDRKIYWKKHIVALVITALIFSTGIFIGIHLTNLRTDYTQDIINQQKAEYESLQLQFLYLTTQQNKSCGALLRSLEQNAYDLETARVKLENYIEGGERGDFNTIKRDYILTEVRYWLLFKDTKKICESNTVSALFFYLSDVECDDCSTQGHILTYLKDLLGENLLVFSFDAGFDEPMIEILKENYNITEYPTMIIADEIYPGLTKKEALIKEICSYYSTAPDACL